MKAKTMFSKLIAAAAFAACSMLALPAALANEGGPALDPFPTEKLSEVSALQTGAKLFVNYCLNCHGAALMRYNRLTDLDLTEEQIRKNLLFSGEKVGDMMSIALRPGDAKEWFGALPPDLSVIARARASEAGSGPSWLYTYLRSYYRDAGRDSGWNNAVFENVGMPHVLWELQGSRGATIEEVKAVRDDKGHVTGATKTVIRFDATGQRSEKTEKIEGHGEHEGRTLTLGKPVGGKLSAAEYDEAVANLVAYITYMSDPSAKTRVRVGVWALMFLAVFFVIAWGLNKSFWKDVT
jgi:ubiquinol-cytochrome c reductase cytochrome c1 subunit